MSKLSISVAMATYNGAAYIRPQLESIAAQTRRFDELVVGDDRSTDETAAIIEEFSGRVTAPVRFHVNPARLGSSRNFEEILQRCKGDIIVLSDQDDIWRPDRLQKIETAFLENPEAAYVFSNGIQIDGAGNPLKESLWDSALFCRSEQNLYRAGRGWDVLLRHNVVTGAAMAVRASAIGSTTPFPPGWIHDYWLAFLLEVSARGVLIDEPLISYRRHAAQQVGLFNFSAYKMIQAILADDASQYAKAGDAFHALAERLARDAACTPLARAVSDKAEFFERRAKMRMSPLSAPVKILMSWWRGDYHRFSPRFRFIMPAIVLDVLSISVSPFKHWGKAIRVAGRA